MRAAAPPHWPCCETASAPKREGEVPWLSMQRSTYPKRPPQSVSLTRAEKCGAKRRSRLVRKRFPVGLQRMLPAWCGSGWRRDLSPCGSGTSSTQKACPWSAWTTRRGQRHTAQHPAQGKPRLEELLLAVALSRPQCHRAHVLPPQGLPPRRHALRPARSQLPRRRLPRRKCKLLVMSPDPNEDSTRKLCAASSLPVSDRAVSGSTQASSSAPWRAATEQRPVCRNCRPDSRPSDACSSR